jgi:nitrite reductase/ring-hydroxylating ferredoxin subunit
VPRARGGGRKIIAGASAELKRRGSLTFRFKQDGFPTEGFVIRVGGKLKAYVNRCPHAGTTLDFGDGDFFTDGKELLMCRTHGALFVPKDGSCAGGPCNGQGLTPLVPSEAEGKIFVELVPGGAT